MKTSTANHTTTENHPMTAAEFAEFCYEEEVCLHTIISIAGDPQVWGSEFGDALYSDWEEILKACGYSDADRERLVDLDDKDEQASTLARAGLNGFLIRVYVAIKKFASPDPEEETYYSGGHWCAIWIYRDTLDYTELAAFLAEKRKERDAQSHREAAEEAAKADVEES